MKKKIQLHPSTLLVFLLALIFKQQGYFILYLFIFLHEYTHLSVARILKESGKICLFPWGCVLKIDSIPSRKKSIFILLSGPLFNLIMYFFGIFPTENLTLALFNLLPVMPLDGGMLLNLTLPSLYLPVALLSVITLFFISLRLHLLPLLPLVLLLLLIVGEKNRIDKNISLRIIGHFNRKA